VEAVTHPGRPTLSWSGRTPEPKRSKSISLKEWTSRPVELTQAELVALKGMGAGLTIEPLAKVGQFAVGATSIVGAVSAPPDLQVFIEPKIPMDRVFYLLGYSARVDFLTEDVELGKDANLVDGFVRLYLNVLRRALARGVLAGYRSVDESSQTLRGRIQFLDQARRRRGLQLPMEIVYDDFTVDIDANRLIKAALRRAERLSPTAASDGAWARPSGRLRACRTSATDATSRQFQSIGSTADTKASSL
jgi:5-methylcytosine-specific restriction enzyme subunit McrC